MSLTLGSLHAHWLGALWGAWPWDKPNDGFQRQSVGPSVNYAPCSWVSVGCVLMAGTPSEGTTASKAQPQGNSVV